MTRPDASGDWICHSDTEAGAPLLAIPLAECWMLGTEEQLPSGKHTKKPWEITVFNGKINELSMAIFNGYLSLPEGNIDQISTKYQPNINQIRENPHLKVS